MVNLSLQLGVLRERRSSDVLAWRQKEKYLERQLHALKCQRLSETCPAEYHRITLSSCRLPTLAGRESGESVGIEERRQFATGVQTMLSLRNKYTYAPKISSFRNKDLLQFQEALNERPYEYHPPPAIGDARSPTGATPEICWRDGVICLKADGKDINLAGPPSYVEFAQDLETVWGFCRGKVANTVAHYRLSMLEANFELHRLVNDAYEVESTRADPQDFHSLKKVDNHIHVCTPSVYFSSKCWGALSGKSEMCTCRLRRQ